MRALIKYKKEGPTAGAVGPRKLFGVLLLSEYDDSEEDRRHYSGYQAYDASV